MQYLAEQDPFFNRGKTSETGMEHDRNVHIEFDKIFFLTTTG